MPNITDARLKEIVALAEQATQGEWQFRKDQDNGQGYHEQLIASNDGEWEKCPYYCRWDEPSLTHRGKQATPNQHEHKRDSTVFAGSGWHGSGDLSVSDEDAAFVCAANPATVKAMAQALLEAREQIAALLNDKAQMQAERKEHRT